MKVNENIAVEGQLIHLVPYRAEHVQKYHEWMSDPELRELTASEPLTLEEEYDMQQKWKEDEDKLTFIILASERTSLVTSEADSEGQGRFNAALPEKSNVVSRMIGDVNLFFKGSPSEEDFEVEAEIMVAEKSFRRRGAASEALQLMLSFATSYEYHSLLPVPVEKFVVRIGDTNAASINLFTKLGFAVTKHVEVFKELEMRPMDKNAKEKWKKGRLVRYE